MNYIEELFARQGALLRAVSRSGSRRRAEESREGEKSPSPAAEVWELAEETARRGVIRVRFPDTVGVPEEFAQVESIILDIIPCHLLTEFCFRYLTWAECELQGFTWRSAEAAQHSWESFEKAVPEQ